MKTQKRHDIIIVQLMSKLNVGRKKCTCIEVHKLDGVNDMNGKNKNNNPSEMIIYTTEEMCIRDRCKGGSHGETSC